MELVRRVATALPIHGSTQMSVTSADGAEFARAAGAERIVVGRELSVDEIAQVCHATVLGHDATRQCMVNGTRLLF